jgi:ribosomal protein S18 acetylase RimI-like enzyme
MRLSEAARVLELWNDNCLEAAQHGLSADESSRLLIALQQYASHPQAFCLVAQADGELVGFLTAYLSSHPILEGMVGEIEELYVQPQVRCTGMGSALVREAVNLLRQQGAGTIRVHACAESPLARAFWSRLGWEQDLVVYSHYEKTM